MEVKVYVQPSHVEVNCEDKAFLFLLSVSYQDELWADWKQNRQAVKLFWSWFKAMHESGVLLLLIQPPSYRLTEDRIIEIIEQHATTMGLGEINISKTTVVGERD